MSGKSIATIVCLCLIAFSVFNPVPSADEKTLSCEKEIVTKVIKDSIGWAQTKDTALLFSTLANDENFFIFNPDPSKVKGIEIFKKQLLPIWLSPDFEATRFEVKELEINFSRSGDAAWFHAYLDDCAKWKGKEGCWQNVRWTGVLEKRDGNWVIVQEHFSYPKE